MVVQGPNRELFPVVASGYIERSHNNAPHALLTRRGSFYPDVWQKPLGFPNTLQSHGI